MIWETNKLCEAEAKLHQSEREQAKLRKQQTKLHARNQETLEELERGTYIYAHTFWKFLKVK